ncbi:hypothetical protein FOZ63_015544, partial [Perkinsus olseni]
DFPPLRNGYIAISDPAGVCKFNNGKKGSDNWSALNVVVQEGEDTSTAFVACPKTEEHDAFTAKFDEGKLKAYGDQSKRNDTNFEFRHTAPPAKTGLDPLANLDKSTFVHIVKRFREFAGYLKTTYFDVSQLEAVSEGMKDFCPLVEEALKKTFETFQNLCLIFSKTKEAIDVARDEQWMFREQTDYCLINCLIIPIIIDLFCEYITSRDNVNEVMHDDDVA